MKKKSVHYQNPFPNPLKNHVLLYEKCTHSLSRLRCTFCCYTLRTNGFNKLAGDDTVNRTESIAVRKHITQKNYPH